MATASLNTVIQNLYRTCLSGDREGMCGGALLDMYVDQRDDVAFAALVALHGPMVLQTCRRVLANVHDAEDAFQATFLVLARKAHSIRPRALVGNWLYGVAYRTALEARSVKFRRTSRESQVHDMPEPPAPQDRLWHELQPLLDREVNLLPAKYRAPVVLCELEGRSRKDVALQLGIPEGTLSSRLAAARKLLAARLTRRGLALSAGTLAAVLAQHTAPAACVPASMAISTSKAATSFAAGPATAAGILAPQVVALAKGTMTAMFIDKLKIGVLLVVLLGLVGAGAGLWSQQGAAAEQVQPLLVAQADAPKEKPGQEPKKGDVPGAAKEKRDGDKPAPKAKGGKGTEVTVSGTVSKTDVKKKKDDGSAFDVTMYTLTDAKGNKIALPGPRINEAGKILDDFKLSDFVGKQVVITARASVVPSADAGATPRVIRVFVINTVKESK